MLRRHLLLLPVAILMVQGLPLVAACGGASRATRVLHRKVGKIHLEYDSPRGVLYSLAETANVVIGVEDVESPSKRSDFFRLPRGDGPTVARFICIPVSSIPMERGQGNYPRVLARHSPSPCGCRNLLSGCPGQNTGTDAVGHPGYTRDQGMA